MIDIKLIREDHQKVKDGLAKRNFSIDFGPLLRLDSERRALLVETEKLQERRNKSAEEFGKLKQLGKNPPETLAAEMNNIREIIQKNEKIILEVETKIEEILMVIPNIPDQSVVVGKSAEDNKVVRQFGEVPKFDFQPRQHWEIGEKLGILDFNAASKLSGPRFALLKGNGCLLERALITFMLDTHRGNGYCEVLAPYLVNKQSMSGTGQLPKFEEELFKVPDDGLYLIPTAEVSVTNIHRGDIVDEKLLPLKYVSYSACFRREAGSYGKDTKGLIRNHQFNKVELVKFTKPEDSMNELESLTAGAEDILKKLGITYRVLELCTGDTGFSSSKTYDLEVWMPGEKRWREISSCSNFKDFQARRMNIKFKRENKSKEFVHTLNGSGLAIGRTFAAILENYQKKDGSVAVPDVLKRYMNIDLL